MTSKSENSAHDLLHNAHFLYLFIRKRWWCWTYVLTSLPKSHEHKSSESSKETSCLHMLPLPSTFSYMLQSFPTLSWAEATAEWLWKYINSPFTISSCSAVHLSRLKKKNRGLATTWRKIIFFLFHYFFSLLLFCVEKKKQIIRKRTEIAQKNQIIKELNAGV